MNTGSRSHASGVSAVLGRELRFAARKRLPQMFKDVAADRATYPTLARVVERTQPQLWTEDPTRALLVVMRRAVQALPEEAAWKCVDRCTWRHVGRLLYFGSEVDSSLQDYDDYLAKFETDSGWPKNRLPWPKRTRGYLTNKLRSILADILLSMERSAIKSTTELTSDSRPSQLNHSKQIDVPASLYVSRDKLHAEFKRFVSGGVKLIALVGLPGMGKSWLARELAGVDSPRIRIEAGTIVSRDLESALIAYGFTDIPADSRNGLARLLSDQRGPRMVVLDNLDSTTQLHDLLPTATRSIVIATCRKQERVPENCRVIEVGAMEPAEAVLMAQQRLPGLSNADAELLAVTTLHRYPLLINHACTLLASRGVTVAQFCNELTQDATGFAERVDVGAEGKLYVVLAGLLDLVQARDSLAYDLLRYISASSLLPFVSRDYLCRCMTVGHGPPISATAFAQALTVLHDMALIVLRDAADEMAWLPAGYVSIHPYTQLVLQRLSSRRPGFRQVAECFLKVHNYYRDNEPPVAEAHEWVYSKWLAEINRAIALTVSFLEKAWRNRELGWLIVFDIASFKASLEEFRRLLNEHRSDLPPGWPEFAWQRMRELIAPRLAEVRELSLVSIDEAILQL